MKKRIVCRILPIILSVSMASSALMGCGDNSQDGSELKDVTSEQTVVDSDIDDDLEEAKKAEEEAKKAEEEAKKAEEEAKKTEEEAKKAEEEAKKAEEEAKKAEEEAKKAEEEAKAEEDRLKAEAEAKKAEEERIKAEEETKKAEEERLKAEAEAKKAEEEAKKAEAEAKKLEEERLLAEQEDELTPTQLTSINMLNYMTVLTQQINNSNGNQLFLESARTSLYNDTNLKAVDTKTQAQITQLVGTIDQYRMVSVKRERLQFIYEQNRAQALRQAMPNPLGLLSAVQSGSLLKAAASVVYMGVDSATSYKSATNQAEMQFIKEGWELDDEEVKVLQDSTTAQFNYMCNMVRDYDLPDEYVVRDTDVKDFVEYAGKTNLVQKIDWLKANESKYQKFGPYWLELVKDYYETGEYKNCLNAIAQYEAIYSKITRKDYDYANVLPMVLIASKETMSKDEYVKTARKYCQAIMDNTKDEDWTLRYFVAQIYLDVYAQTNKKDDLKCAYDIAYYNVNTLVDEQRALNLAYLNPIEEAKAGKSATKREKEEIKQYNKLIKEERKVAVPPVSEALYLNCDLLFAVADKLGVSTTDRNRIDQLLHENNEDLFLTKALDNKFRNSSTPVKSEDIQISFDGETLVIPVKCISDRSKVTVKVTGNSSETLDDWVITEVSRPKNSTYNDFTVTMKSEKGNDHDYAAGDKITITVIPVEDSESDAITFTYEVVAVKKAWVFNGISFERK